MKKKNKWKVIGFSLLGILIVVIGISVFEYDQLQPKNHFKTIPVVSSDLAQSPTNTSTNKDSEVDDPNFNILVLGSDERGSSNVGHSDTIMLAHIDLRKNQINAVSIPRDTRVHLDGYGYTKLTSVQYILQSSKGPKQGVIGAVQAISELTGVPINYYIETNFEGFQSMVDSMGGIHMNVPFNVNIGSQIVAPGSHFVDGKTVLSIVRERHSLANGDYGRQELQLEALKGIAKDALSPSNISKLPSLAHSVSQYLIATNMSTTDMISLGLAVKGIDPNKQVTYQQLKGVGKSMYDDILKAKNDEIIIDQEEMKQIIEKDFKK